MAGEAALTHLPAAWLQGSLISHLSAGMHKFGRPTNTAVPLLIADDAGALYEHYMPLAPASRQRGCSPFCPPGFLRSKQLSNRCIVVVVVAVVVVVLGLCRHACSEAEWAE